MWLTLAIFSCFQFINMNYIYFVEINNMEKATIVEDLELRKIQKIGQHEKERVRERDKRQIESVVF